MIIFGTKGVTSTKESGSFFCPECGEERGYAHKRVRRFFTLYFIPLLPLDQVGEYVECASCRGTYRPGVLESDPGQESAAAVAEFEKGTLRVMVHMMLVDGDVDAEEVATIQHIHHDLTGKELTAAAVQDEIIHVQETGHSAVDDLAQFAGYLNDQGKETVMRAAISVAAADGRMDDSEAALLQSIRKAIDMTPAHLKGLMAEMQEASE